MSIVLIGGPIGVGKTSIVECMLQTNSLFVRPMAFTSRPERPEDAGGQFLHTTTEEIDRLWNSGELLTLDSHHGNYYGLSKQSVLDIKQDRKVAVKEFYLSDHPKIKAIYPDTITIAVMPSSDEAHKEHVQRIASVKERVTDRGGSDLAIHKSFLENQTVDIIIYNDYKETILNITSRLIGSLKTILTSL